MHMVTNEFITASAFSIDTTANSPIFAVVVNIPVHVKSISYKMCWLIESC